MTVENLNDLEKLKAFMEELGKVQHRYIEDLEKRIEQLTEIIENLQEKNDQLVAENDQLVAEISDNTSSSYSDNLIKCREKYNRLMGKIKGDSNEE